MSEHILYHGLCLAVLVLTYLGSKGTRNQLAKSLVMVYEMIALIVASDCAWGILSYCGYSGAGMLYFVNIVYFTAEILGVYAWMRFTLKTLNSYLYKNNTYRILLTVPAVLVSVLTLTTSITGWIFTIENGAYVRGKLFFVDTVLKLCYLLFSSVYAFIMSRKESRKYIRRQYFLLAVYCIPVVVAGIFQSIFGIDLNCVAVILGLAIVYKFGLANELKENGDLVNAIANAYSAAFIINTDDHTMRALSHDGTYSELASLAAFSKYKECIYSGILARVVPEDRIMAEKGFSVRNILKQLTNKISYSFIYKIIAEDGSEEYNKATFFKAFSDEDRHELFLGIEKLDTQQILLQEKEALESEKEEFERVKESFTNVIANIIEARDIDSGEHVMRVKSITQYLCNQIMEDYPEYGLTPLTIRYITNGSALHDIGKIMIPDAILLKPGKLTDEEMAVMKTHSEKGCVILDKLPADLDAEYTEYAKEICRWHHEKYDGRGYPDGLVGDQIPISAQIVSLADCFDALTTKRVYKDAISKEAALKMILDGECGAFNDKLLDCLQRSFDRICQD